MLKIWAGPAMLAIGFVIVTCAFGQEMQLKSPAPRTSFAVTAGDTALDTVKPCVRTAAEPKASAVPAPIAISVLSPGTALLNTSAATVSVSGTASGAAGIMKVMWQTSNGATGVASVEPFLESSGGTSFGAAGIPVLQGTTTITLRAFDSNGASNWIALVAVRP